MMKNKIFQHAENPKRFSSMMKVKIFKKELLIIALVLAIGFLIAGCANKQAQQQPADNQLKTSDIVADTPIDTQKTDVVDTKLPEAPVKPETPVAEPEETTTEPAKLPVTQEELDSLKTGIEGIQAEDLGGLQ